MVFDFAAAKANARRVVHKTLGVQAFYQDSSLDAAIETRARWHNRIDRFGDDERQGNAELVEGIERIVLVPEIWETDVNENSVNTGEIFDVKRGGTVYFPDYSTTFILDFREPIDGQIEQIWQAARS